MAVGPFIGEEPVGAVFLDRASHGQTVLGAGVGRLINVAERVGRLDVTVAQVSKGAAVELVGARLGNNVDHAARRLSVFRGIAVGEDLKLLHRVLRHGGADSVGRIVHRVGAVDVDQVAAGALS